MSRYGFAALFFSVDKHLARLYADYEAKKDGRDDGGFLFEFDLSDNMHYHNFNGLSYSEEYVDLIHQLYDEGHKQVLIQNVIDYPTQEYSRFVYTDLVVVFDFGNINSYRLIESNVKF